MMKTLLVYFCTLLIAALERALRLLKENRATDIGARGAGDVADVSVDKTFDAPYRTQLQVQGVEITSSDFDPQNVLDVPEKPAPISRQEIPVSPSAAQISFCYTVQDSFFSPNHPITIPGALRDRANIMAFGRAKCAFGSKAKITITGTSGRRFEGYVYHGQTDWGPYSQIKILEREASGYTSNLRLGERLKITLEGRSDTMFATFSLAHGQGYARRSFGSCSLHWVS